MARNKKTKANNREFIDTMLMIRLITIIYID